ncbi:cellulase CEL6B [Dendrothele bispora CBS 962.96]|uniref:Glucanase n=1 Tax=Dendrothele bispora (strain CBS 962.96) TaxID=1314807 RepID=A0A4S8MXG8_DENBC|nr:cellulase CEL6B [Dendrothele bispora CBS 962.96]
MKITSVSLLALVSFIPFAVAQSPQWGQCGGIGWSGATTCVSGSSCTVVNPYYSQCIPGSNAPPPSSTVAPTTSRPGSSSTSAPAPTGTTTPSADNPFNGYTLYLSPVYAEEVAAAAAQMSGSSSSAAASVANIPTFIWFDTIAKVADLETYLADASAKGKADGKKYLVQIVVYDLPDRDCSAFASNGEFSIANNGEANYHSYIDALVKAIGNHPDVRVVAVVEPDSLANLVTNLNVQKCANAQDVYKRCVTYAMQQLSTVGVYQYLDAGHAGWLGWPANLSPAAQLFNNLYTAAGSPKFVRGLATNVANYNALRAASPDPITQGNNNYDEIHYIQALAPLLTSFPAHFIVDQGRSGVQNIRQQWGDWCNVKGAGFGTRPTLNTGSSLIDAIVWVKPGGECDGTSDSSSPRFDSHCALSDALQPAPEAGTWFQNYFQQLVTNANPAL